MPLVHHELCFGCGRTNLFGLLLEAEQQPGGPDRIAGRCFIKQDHQGPARGYAHPGILATALVEAMQLLAGDELTIGEVALKFAGPAPVGAFVAVTAQREGADAASAIATTAGDEVASARGRFKPCPRT